MRLKNKRTGIIILILLCVLMAMLIGPMDYFRHGHYYEEYNISGDAYQKSLQEHDVKENKFLINKLVFGEISLNDSES